MHCKKIKTYIILSCLNLTSDDKKPPSENSVSIIPTKIKMMTTNCTKVSMTRQSARNISIAAV